MKRSGTRIRTIVVYKRNGIDDASVGLVQELFVLGIPEMIDLLVKDIPNAEAGFTLWFSAAPFPGQQARLSSGGSSTMLRSGDPPHIASCRPWDRTQEASTRLRQPKPPESLASFPLSRDRK